MRYIGGKSYLLEKIHTENKSRGAQSVIDIFAGSGAVSAYLSQNGYNLISDDFLYFSYVLNRGLLVKSSDPKFNKLKIYTLLKELNDIDINSSAIDRDKCFVWQNYSLHEGCDRMYFREDNALRIDQIRQRIEEWRNILLISEGEYYYLLALLIYAVPSVSNIAGVYGAYLKSWDPRTFKKLVLEPFNLIDKGGESKVLNLPFFEALKNSEADLIYADPPYNSRQYLPNYHILETIARYDYLEIHGATGIRAYDSTQKSDFCSKSKVAGAFISLIEKARVKSIVISYNGEGIMPEADLDALCYGYSKPSTFKKTTIPYRRFKSHSGKSKEVNELILSFDK